MALFVIALKLLDVLAWPLLALGYPLHASIVAIEADSNADAQKLVTYWVLFSLISLVEHALGTLLVWLPFWSYIKLGFVIWLMIPHFDGSFYVYEHFIRPFLSISARVITNGLNKQKELSLNGDDFLVEAEKCLNDNGPEVLEKLLSSQSMCKKPMVAPKHVIAAEAIEKKEVTAVNETRYNENTASSQEDITVNEFKEGKVDKAVPNQTESGIRFGTLDDIEIPNTATELPKPESVEPPQESQREWTCAICQVKAHSEHILKSHLEGKKHKAAVDALKAKKQSMYARKLEKAKRQVSESGRPWCCICNVTCSGLGNFLAHCNGKKHIARIEELRSSPNAGQLNEEFKNRVPSL